MHGRLKVRTTEEERERKKKEQTLKVLAYNAAMTKIQIKRQKDEYDDEMLKLTLPILQRNPDVYTLWNIRRLCIESKFIKTSDTSDDATKELKKTAFETELRITEQCLMVSPKSYAAWHHRCWTLENSTNPDWQREMQLCTKYLKLDERNFHTWDYRRYIAAKAGVSKEQELEFCTDKIKTNFSNYSSWHYRSQLLPELYPYEGDALPKRPMAEEKLKEELEMVLSAAFTDPNDSSAWFYQRWLLSYSRPALDICAFRCDNRKAVAAFTKPLHGKSINISIYKYDKLKLALTEWISVRNTMADTIWYCTVPDGFPLDQSNDCEYRLVINIPDFNTKKINLNIYKGNLYVVETPNPPILYSNDVLTELQAQLDSCKSLLEFEPESKWTLLTTALIMRAIDRIQYHEKSLELLQKLIKVDTLRKGYYEDLGSKWILEHSLTDWVNLGRAPGQINLDTIRNLTSVASYEQYFSISDNLILPTKLETKYAIKSRVPFTFSTIESLINES